MSEGREQWAGDDPAAMARASAGAVATSGRRDEIARLASLCVNCGVCNGSCPTYLASGDEREGPRGRIGLIRGLGAAGPDRHASRDVARHIARCLGCRSCEAACPTGVDYAHLLAHGRSLVRGVRHASRKARVIDWFAAEVVPFPDRLRRWLTLAPMVRRFGGRLPNGWIGKLGRVAAAAAQVKARTAAFPGPGTAKTKRDRRGRVILLAGCAQQVLRPSITDSAIRVLARSGIDVEVVAGAGCCGATRYEQGDEAGAGQLARANVDAWSKSLSREPADAILTTAGGCGGMVADYGYLLRQDRDYAAGAAEIGVLAEDILAFVARIGIGPAKRYATLKVACHKSCSLAPEASGAQRKLVHDAGFTAVDAAPEQICCGGRGTYPFLETATANALRAETTNDIRGAGADVVATGSLACLSHLEGDLSQPVVHTIELIDWAHGGPVPPGLEHLSGEISDVPGIAMLDVDEFIAG